MFNRPTWEEWYAEHYNEIIVGVQQAFSKVPGAEYITYGQEIGDTIYYAAFNRDLTLRYVQGEPVH